MTQLRGLAGRGAFGEHLLDGIARDDVNHQEHGREHEPDGGKGEEDSFEQVA